MEPIRFYTAPASHRVKHPASDYATEVSTFLPRMDMRYIGKCYRAFRKAGYGTMAARHMLSNLICLRGKMVGGGL